MGKFSLPQSLFFAMVCLGLILTGPATCQPAHDPLAGWEPIAPHRAPFDRFTLVWLAGTPYEMGQQQGELLHAELAAAMEWLSSTHLVDVLLPLAKQQGILDMAWQDSYPDIIEECQGLVDATTDIGWTMDVCLLLNFGDVLVEFLASSIPSPDDPHGPGCTQIAAANAASRDGKLYHGRSLDWSKIQYLLDYPVVFIRQPADGIPHTYIGFPGNLSPYSGMNAYGISMASDEVDPYDDTQHDSEGRSHVQMLGQVLKKAHTLDEAKAFIENQDHMSVEIFMVTDGQKRAASVFEMTAKVMSWRDMNQGQVFTTNHFIDSTTANADEDPASDSSLLRYDRLKQLVPPDGSETYYGKIDGDTMVKILRDRVNPYTGQESRPGAFDNNESIATNGAIYQIVFEPEDLCFWVAAGETPVPEQPFIGFSLGDLLQLNAAKACFPAQYR
jgi:hypothetical protein